MHVRQAMSFDLPEQDISQKLEEVSDMPPQIANKFLVEGESFGTFIGVYPRSIESHQEESRDMREFRAPYRDTHNRPPQLRSGEKIQYKGFSAHLQQPPSRITPQFPTHTLQFLLQYLCPLFRVSLATSRSRTDLLLQLLLFDGGLHPF